MVQYLLRDYNFIDKAMRNIYLKRHHINILQVTLNVPQNHPKLNPCYRALGRTLTLPLQCTLCNKELNTLRQRNEEYIHLEYRHINTLQITLNDLENQPKLMSCYNYKTLVRTLPVPYIVPYVPRNYNIMSNNMQNIHNLNITT